MDTKAGELFRCACCGDESDQSEASFDEQLNGPVCDDCRKNIRGALAWMKEVWGRDVRPLCKSDINNSNHKRFLI